MGVLRSAGALDCVSSLTYTTKSPHSELWVGVTLEAVRGVFVGEVVSDCRTPNGAFEFTEEWSQGVFHSLGSMKQDSDVFPAASMMHEQRLVNDDPFAPVVGGILGHNFQQLVSSPDKLNATAIVCLWNELISKRSTQKNLFPIQFIEAIQAKAQVPGCQWSDLLSPYLRCLGSTGLCFAPAALRDLEKEQLIGRLKVMRRKGSDTTALDLLTGGGTFSNMKCNSLDGVHLGLLERLDEIVKCANGNSENVQTFFTELRREMDTVFSESVLMTGNGVCAYALARTKRALTALMSGRHPVVWKDVIRFLLRHDDFSFLIIPIIEVIVDDLQTKDKTPTEDHINKYVKSRPLSKILVSIYDSVLACRDAKPDNRPAKVLQAKLQYPSIVFEELHPEVPESYLKSRLKKLKQGLGSKFGLVAVARQNTGQTPGDEVSEESESSV